MTMSLARRFALSLGASAAAALLAAGALLALRGSGGSGAATALRWALVALPPAVAVAAAGLLASSPASVALNALGFFLPQACVLVLGFLLLAHPGGPGGLPALAATGLFWAELAGLYLVSLALVGASAGLARLVLRG